MLIAMLVLGVGAGALGATFALFAGANLLACIAIYACTGAVSILLTALVVLLLNREHDAAVAGQVIVAE